MVKTRCTVSGPLTITSRRSRLAGALVGGDDRAQPGGVEEGQSRAGRARSARRDALSTRRSASSTLSTVDRSSSPRSATYTAPVPFSCVSPPGWFTPARLSVRGLGLPSRWRAAAAAQRTPAAAPRTTSSSGALAHARWPRTTPATTPDGRQHAHHAARLAGGGCRSRSCRQAPTTPTKTIASSEVASAPSCDRSEEEDESGHEQHAAAHADEPAEHPAPAKPDREHADQIVAASTQTTRTTAEASSSSGEAAADRALGDALLQGRARHHPDRGRAPRSGRPWPRRRCRSRRAPARQPRR